MRIIRISLIAALSVFFVACGNEFVPRDYDKEVVLDATMSRFYMTDMPGYTRTAHIYEFTPSDFSYLEGEIEKDGAVTLKDSADISVFMGNGNGGGYRFYSFGTNSDGRTILYGRIKSSDSDKGYCAVLPYDKANEYDGSSFVLTLPSVQEGVADGFSNSSFVAIAKSRDENLTFKNVCGAIKFCLSSDDVKSISFKGKHHYCPLNIQNSSLKIL